MCISESLSKLVHLNYYRCLPFVWVFPLSDWFSSDLELCLDSRLILPFLSKLSYSDWGTKFEFSTKETHDCCRGNFWVQVAIRSFKYAVIQNSFFSETGKRASNYVAKSLTKFCIHFAWCRIFQISAYGTFLIFRFSGGHFRSGSLWTRQLELCYRTICSPL